MEQLYSENKQINKNIFRNLLIDALCAHWYESGVMETNTLLTKSSEQVEPEGMLSPAELRRQTNPALTRLALVVEDRNTEDGATNYSRTHHRHARSHTRR